MVRCIVAEPDWRKQRRMWKSLLSDRMVDLGGSVHIYTATELPSLLRVQERKKPWVAMWSVTPVPEKAKKAVWALQVSAGDRVGQRYEQVVTDR